MYDVSHDNTVSKQDLTTLLNHIPKETLQLLGSLSRDNVDNESREREDSLSYSQKAAAGEYDYVDYYTNHDMVERAFAECDLNHEGRLTYEEFKMWVQRTPTVMDYIESILPYNGPKDHREHHDKKETLPHMRRISSRFTVNGPVRNSSSVHDLAGDIFNHSTSTHKPRSTSISGRASSVSGAATPRNGSLSPLPSGSSTPNPSQVRHSYSFNGQVVDALQKVGSNLERHDSTSSEHFDLPDVDEAIRQLLIQALELSQNEALRDGINNLLENNLGGGVIMPGRTYSSEVCIYSTTGPCCCDEAVTDYSFDVLRVLAGYDSNLVGCCLVLSSTTRSTARSCRWRRICGRRASPCSTSWASDTTCCPATACTTTRTRATSDPEVPN